MELNIVQEVLAGPFGDFVNSKEYGPLVIHVARMEYRNTLLVGVFLHNVAGECVLWEEADMVDDADGFARRIPETATHPGFLAAVQALKLLQ